MGASFEPSIHVKEKESKGVKEGIRRKRISSFKMEKDEKERQQGRKKRRPVGTSLLHHSGLLVLPEHEARPKKISRDITPIM